jgi:glycosyltransferase involved in cell wall biosynthesis
VKVGIDIRPLRDVTTGVGRYVLKMLEALARRDEQNSYVLFYNGLGGAVPNGLPINDNFRVTRFRWPRKLLTATWAYTEFPDLERFVGDVDVFHCPGFQVPPSRRSATVFTIHDLIALSHPELSIPSSVRHFRPRVKHYARRADMIAAVSKATAAVAMEHLDLPEDKVAVVYPGATHFRRADPDDVSGMKNRFGIKGDFILFVSRLDPRKNLARLFRAFEMSSLAADFEFLFVGPKGWRMEEMIKTWRSVKCSERIRWLDYVTDDDLGRLYSGAAFLAYPSIVEGFGLPILEAMSVGCPVLTSNVSSMPEVAGDAAFYVDPFDVDSIAQGLVQLASDSDLRDKLAGAGYERVKSFTWDKMAENILAVYERASESESRKK